MTSNTEGSELEADEVRELRLVDAARQDVRLLKGANACKSCKPPRSACLGLPCSNNQYELRLREAYVLYPRHPLPKRWWAPRAPTLFFHCLLQVQNQVLPPAA